MFEDYQKIDQVCWELQEDGYQINKQGTRAMSSSTTPTPPPSSKPSKFDFKPLSAWSTTTRTASERSPHLEESDADRNDHIGSSSWQDRKPDTSSRSRTKGVSQGKYSDKTPAEEFDHAKVDAYGHLKEIIEEIDALHDKIDQYTTEAEEMLDEMEIAKNEEVADLKEQLSKSRR